jgi:hypothetical protein
MPSGIGTIGGHRLYWPHCFCFNASTHAAVDAFYSEALRAGGTDNGRPGLRLQYGPTYYAAFVIDPDGHPIEAVC